AVNSIWVSHKPDHSYEKAMHNDTAYALLDDGRVGVHKIINGKRTFVEEKLKVIPITNAKAGNRHGYMPDGSPRPYKGYKGDSNYCIEIVRNDKNGEWLSEVVSTYEAYQIVRKLGQKEGWKVLRNPNISISEKP